EEFKLYYDYIDGSYSYDSLSRYLLGMSEVKPKTLQFILDKLPADVSKVDIMEDLKNIIGVGGVGRFQGLYNKYKYLLDQNDTDELILRVENNYEQSGYDPIYEDFIKVLES
ncbi:MAG TPA: hypothetical protein VKR58_11850, partial [Aquella sp.]|nr:hypothetical protein [Aquella sp.]